MLDKIAAIDFETYYDAEVSITELGVHGYCYHSNFNAYLVSVVTDEIKFVGHPKDAPWSEIQKHFWVSHNAAFDRYVFKSLCDRYPDNMPKWGMSKALGDDWNCTANMSAFLRVGRSLLKAAKNLLNLPVSKDVRSMMKGMTPEKMQKTKPSDLTAFANFYEEVQAYALRDSEICFKLWAEHSQKWPEREKALSLLTIKSCIRGFPVDLDLIERNIQVLNKESADAQNRLPWVAKGEKPLSRKSFFNACIAAGIPAPTSLAKENEEFELWNETYGEKYPWAKDRRIVNQAAIVLSRLHRMVDNSYEVDDWHRMSYSLLYFGAHTGRWSGAEGFNVQNMNKDVVCGVNVRNHIAVKAPQKLIICDLAQIEARVTPYLAGDMDLLELVAQGVSVYEAHARTTMNWMPKGKKLKDEDPKLYLLAKTRVLALGFGCGWKRFKVMARKMLGMDISDEEAKKIVNDYRKQNPKIVGLWETLDSGLRDSIRKKEDYVIELPSGRELRYIKPEFVRDVQADKTSIRCKIDADGHEAWVYGAFLTENAVQATARDVFAEAILRLENSGKYPVLFHVHDEAIVESGPNGTAKEVEELMTITPSWLEGCPIGAEAHESQFYLK